MLSIKDIIIENTPVRQGAKGTYQSPCDSAQFLYPQIKDFNDWSDGCEPHRHAMIEYMMGMHMLSRADWLFDWCDKARITMKNKKIDDEDIYAGDMDVFIYMLLDTEDKTVFHVSNHCTCADVADWLIVYEKDSLYEKVSIRELHKKADLKSYGDKKKYNLKYYKDNGFKINQNDYTGYVITVEKDTQKMKDLHKSLGLKDSMPLNCDSLHYFYAKFKHAMFNLRQISMAFTKPVD